MPTACRHPVAITNPMLYISPLWPAGNSVPCAWPWKMAKKPTSIAATASGGFASDATISPSSTADSATPISTPGSGMPTRPRNPPTAITIGNVTGSSHTAGAPSCAPHRPTAIIAST